MVHTSNPDITRLFNLVYAPTRLGASDYTQGLSGYTLDAEGNIDFPVLGKIHLGSMRREEAAAHIKELLLSSEMTRDAVVTVEFMTQENGPCCRTPTSPPCGACRSAPTDAPWRAKPNGCSATAPTRSQAPTCTGNQKNFAISSSLRCCGWLGSPSR